jgi:4-hydroxy-2-oxoheptanedioate aldolase
MPQMDDWFTPDAERTGIGFFCSMSSPLSAEMLAATGIDFVVIDLQHGEASPDDVANMTRAVDVYGVTPLVRVPWCEPSGIMRALDSGAAGVIVPMVNTLEEATLAGRATRYASLGNRSYGPMRRVRSVEAANAAVRCLPMIESARGLDQVEAIVGVSTVDGLFVGLGDLAIDLGVALSDAYTSPQVLDGVRKCVDAARSVGKVVGGIVSDLAQARRLADIGLQFIALGNDKRFVASGAEAAVAAWRQSDVSQVS